MFNFIFQWTSTGRAKFKTILAEEASEYCRDNTAMCLMIDAAQPTLVLHIFDSFMQLLFIFLCLYCLIFLKLSFFFSPYFSFIFVLCVFF